MMICIIELGTGLLACSLATLRPLLALWVDMTAPTRYALSNIFSKSQHNNTDNRSLGNNGATTSFPLNGQDNNHLSSLPSKARDLEMGEDIELHVFESKDAAFSNMERGRSEGSDVSLVYEK
jgi:hypothetical protein